MFPDLANASTHTNYLILIVKELVETFSSTKKRKFSRFIVCQASIFNKFLKTFLLSSS